MRESSRTVIAFPGFEYIKVRVRLIELDCGLAGWKILGIYYTTDPLADFLTISGLSSIFDGGV